MTTIHELQQVLWADTPKGLALIKFMVCDGPDSDILWVTAINETGECWTFSNEDIRFAKNLTLGRRSQWEPEMKPVKRGVPNSMKRMLRA